MSGTAIQKDRRPTALERVMGSYRDHEAATKRLQYAAEHFHLVSPATVCPRVPEGCNVSLSSVFVDPGAETYDVGSGKKGLAKSALDRIAAAAGISWDARQSCRLDDGRDPHYCAWRAVGTMRSLDGTEIQLIGTKEMDLRDGSPQVVALQEKAKAKGRASADTQIREMRLHILAHAETKARLRAIRSLGIRSSYDPKELTKPFVVARIMWTGESSDPELRHAFAMKQADAMLGGVRALYGGEVAPAPMALPVPQHAAPPLGSVPREADDFVDVDEATPPPKRQRRNTPAKGTQAEPAQLPADAAPAAASDREPGDEPCFRFGRSKGEPLSDAEDSDLEWYADAVRSSVDDPKKSRFRSDNERHLAEVEAELRRRNGEVAADDEPRGNGEGDFDVPDFGDDDGRQAGLKL